MLVFSNFIINFAMLWKLYVHVILTMEKYMISITKYT